jgi:hypothetical protein
MGIVNRRGNVSRETAFCLTSKHLNAVFATFTGHYFSSGNAGAFHNKR